MAKSVQTELREWLEQVVKKTGMPPTRLANHIKVSPSTLTRPLNDPNYSSTMSVATIQKLIKVSGIPAPVSLSGVSATGFSEPEVSRYSANTKEIPALQPLTNAESEWVVSTLLLDLEGYLPGDHVIVNLNEQARAGDTVVAQVLTEDGSADTVFRRYEPPFIVAHTTARDVPKPVYIDHERAVILGVVTKSWRLRNISKNVA